MIENSILNGTLNVDDQVYSTNQLSSIYGINPATARKGLSLLVDEGIIYKKRGLGMFVCPHALKIIQDKRKEGFLENYMESMMREAQKLKLTKEELIEMIKNSDILED